MQKVNRGVNKLPNGDEEIVIYVEECNKYEYENPEIPKKDLHNENEHRIYDIIEQVENYYY